MSARILLPFAGLLLGLLVPADTQAQALSRLPSVTSQPRGPAFVLVHLEAPAEIALGTMAVNVWARIQRPDGDPIAGATLVLPGEDRPLEMKAVDGAFDSPVEEVVATIDTFTWPQDELRTFELRARAGGLAPAPVATGSIRIKSRLATGDLFLLDERGQAAAWIGSGAGGFTPGTPLDAGFATGGIDLADLDRDRFVDVLVPDEQGQVRLFRNRGAGRFELDHVVDCGADLVHAAVGDLDADGRQDLVTITGDGALEIRLGLADVPDQSSILTLAPDRLELADLDGDGRPEIYVALLGLIDGEIQVWTAEGSGPWSPTGRLDPGEEGRERVRGLLRVSGASQAHDRLLVLSAGMGEGMLESWGWPADTNTESEPALLARFRVPGEPLLVTWGRFRADGRESWVALVREGLGAVFYGSDDNGTPRRVGNSPSVPTDWAVLDVDADGDDDLVTGGEDLRVWINVQGRLREAGESPYFLDAAVTALVSGSLDERSP